MLNYQELIGLSTEAQLANSTNSMSTNSTLGTLSDFSIGTISFNPPFIVLFFVLLISSVVSYCVQFPKLKKNQHILFWLLFVNNTAKAAMMKYKKNLETFFLVVVMSPDAKLVLILLNDLELTLQKYLQYMTNESQNSKFWIEQ